MSVRAFLISSVIFHAQSTEQQLKQQQQQQQQQPLNSCGPQPAEPQCTSRVSYTPHKMLVHLIETTFFILFPLFQQANSKELRGKQQFDSLCNDKRSETFAFACVNKNDFHLTLDKNFVYIGLVNEANTII